MEYEQPGTRQRPIPVLSTVAIAPKGLTPRPLLEDETKESARKEPEAQPNTLPAVTGEVATGKVEKEAMPEPEEATESDQIKRKRTRYSSMNDQISSP
ncbi:hypothetical protein ON010_g8127 [Phytophthora cinnamomi]|nr:hypothetical protein ON010_g8127 [Phytophthora cinnamomi]